MKIQNQDFKDDKIQLDGNEFHDCNFVNCEMIYSGTGPVGMVRCVFSGVRWTMAGPAGSALSFMKTLVKGSDGVGYELIVNTFPGLREWVLEQNRDGK